MDRQVVITEFERCDNYDFGTIGDNYLDTTISKYVKKYFPKEKILAQKGNIIILKDRCYGAFYPEQLTHS